LGFLERAWPVDGFRRIFDPKMGLRLAVDSRRSPKISNFGNDEVLSIRNFMMMPKTPSNYSFEHLCYGHDPMKVPKGLKKGLSFEFQSLLVTNGC
jgi:hypothetical protein